MKEKRGAKRKAVKKGKSKKETIVTQVAKQENAEHLDDISNLLVQGEGAPDEGEEEGGGEADEEKEPLVSKDGVEITVAMPEGLKKKKRKGFDVAAYIKRKIGKARREVRIIIYDPISRYNNSKSESGGSSAASGALRVHVSSSQTY